MKHLSGDGDVISDGFVEIPASELDQFGMPVWMECTWRRVTCGRVTCRFCRMQFALECEIGEELGQPVPEDEGPSHAEALAAIRADASAKGFEMANGADMEEAPEPEAFPLYRHVRAWHDDIMHMVQEAHNTEVTWLETDAGKDFIWYVGTITAKTYRQLSTRWELDHGSDYGEDDYQWTQQVLRESCALVSSALAALLEMPSGPPSADLFFAQAQLEHIEAAILEI